MFIFWHGNKLSWVTKFTSFLEVKQFKNFLLNIYHVLGTKITKTRNCILKSQSTGGSEWEGKRIIQVNYKNLKGGMALVEGKGEMWSQISQLKHGQKNMYTLTAHAKHMRGKRGEQRENSTPT